MKAKLQGTAFPICLYNVIPLIGRLASRGPCARVGACVEDCFSRCVESNRFFEAAFALLLTWGIVSGESALQKALPADIAALEADALLGALLLKTSLAEAPAREVLHARLEKLEGVLDTHRRVGEGLEVGDVWVFH